METDTKRDTRFLALPFPVFTHCELFRWMLNGEAYVHFKSLSCDSTLDQRTRGPGAERPGLRRRHHVPRQKGTRGPKESVRVKAGTTMTFLCNPPALFHVNIL